MWPCREEHPSVFRDRTEEWYYPQLEANTRARWILGMNETMPPNETESSLKYYGMGTVRWGLLALAVSGACKALHEELTIKAKVLEVVHCLSLEHSRSAIEEVVPDGKAREPSNCFVAIGGRMMQPMPGHQAHDRTLVVYLTMQQCLPLAVASVP